MLKTKLFSIFGLLAVMIAISYHSFNYGVSQTELAYSKTGVGILVAAESERSEQVKADAGIALASIANAKQRDNEIALLKAEVAGYEYTLQKQRTVACNLHADTVASMQQFATGGTDKQLEPGAGIFNEPAVPVAKATDNWQSFGNGGFVLRERQPILGQYMRSNRFAAFYTVTTKAGITA